jgi:hypothetical protein
MVEHGERIARTETRLEAIVDDIREIKEALKAHTASVDARLSKIETTLSERKGGWAVVLWLGGGGVALGTALGGAFTYMLGKMAPLSRFLG